jgi:hypothetical protein
MKEGKISKSIIYFPVLLLIAFAIYYGTVFLAGVYVHI